MIVTCISICVLAFVIGALIYFSSLSRKGANLAPGKSPGAHLLWAGMSFLVIILTACSGLTSSNQNVTPTITPLALTTAPQPTSTPNTPTSTGTDWTTYHANTLHTGYIASTPDPHSLSKIWTTKLDGSVYAEPLVVGNNIIV